MEKKNKNNQNTGSAKLSEAKSKLKNMFTSEIKYERLRESTSPPPEIPQKNQQQSAPELPQKKSERKDKNLIDL